MFATIFPSHAAVVASFVLDVAIVLAGLAGLIVVGGFVSRAFNETLGRKRSKYRRLRSLAADAQLEFFTSTLGHSPVLRNEFDAPVTKYTEDGAAAPQKATFVQHFYVDRDYTVQTISNTGDRVLAYSVTTRQEGFNPTFRPVGWPSSWTKLRRLRGHDEASEPLFSVALGHTRFDGLTEWPHPDRIVAWLGARAGAYSEEYYFGNPGYYQTYVFTASSAGQGPIGPLHDLWADVEFTGDFRWPGSDARDFEDLERVHTFRNQTAVTTYTVIGSGLLAADYPTTYGPHGDEIRKVPVS